jgi:hypothetical protein
MYHGTSATPPNFVFSGEEGFNMNFSSGGMWGIAVYFAKNSSYSNGYSYAVPGTGERQMFQATVIVGKAAVL